MRIKHIVLAIAMLLLTAGCYEEVKGTVVDAETGEPIEGAVVLVQWTKTKGLGLTYHEVYKIIEVETDKNGKFTVSGAYNPFVNPPIIVVYKKDYVAWRNDFIFPDYEKRNDFKWQNDYVFRLERFKENYSKEEHHYFIGHGIIGADFNQTPKFSAARGETSREAQQESEKKKNNRY